MNHEYLYWELRCQTINSFTLQLIRQKVGEDSFDVGHPRMLRKSQML